MFDNLKTGAKALLAYTVSWVNFSISGMNEFIGLLVGVLTSVYLITQIRKNLKNNKS